MDFVNTEKVLKELHELEGNKKEMILKGLEIAKEIEESSKTFYEKEVEKTTGNLQDFFKFLVKEEEGHLEKVEELRGMVDSGEFEKISFEEHVAPKPEEVKAGKEEMLAILYALHREKKAREFYNDLSNMAEGETREFFKELSEFENEHVDLLEEYVDSMQNVGELIMG